MTDQTPPPVVVVNSSKFGSVNLRDFLNGLVMAVGGAVFTVIENSVSAGIFTIDWTNIWHIALGAFVIYIGKNFFTPGVTKIKGLQAGSTATITVPPVPPNKSVTVTDVVYDAKKP